MFDVGHLTCCMSSPGIDIQVPEALIPPTGARVMSLTDGMAKVNSLVHLARLAGSYICIQDSLGQGYEF
jgi:hypothetical protein